MHFYNLAGFLAFAAVPVIIAMYLLKEKYREETVSSLFLWEKALAQSDAHRPWQKLRKNILMFLQILGAVLFAIALANPFLVNGKKIDNVILVLDQSLSMQAEENGISRFEQAKREMTTLVNQSAPETAFSLITLGKNPEIVLSAAQEKGVVLNALSSIEVTSGGVDLDGCLSLIEMREKESGGNVYIFTDTTYEYGTDRFQVVPFGSGGENCALTLLSYHGGDRETVMVKAANYGKEAAERTLTIFGDNAALDYRDITLQPGEAKDFYFEGNFSGVTYLKASLTPGDMLKADDEAFYSMKKGERKRILLVTEQNIFLDKILSLLDTVEVYRQKEAMEAEGYALYIYDGVLPDKMPADGHILLLNPPAGNPFIETGETVEISTVQKDSASWLLQSAGGLDFAVAKAVKMIAPSWADTILFSGETPLVLAGETGKQKVMAFGFDLHDSDLPLKKEFPILIYNMISWYFPGNVQGVAKINAEDKVEFDLLPQSERVQVMTPSGKTIDLAPPYPAASLSDTRETGIYTLVETNAEKEEVRTAFAVNAATEGESELRGVTEQSGQMKQGGGILTDLSLRNLFLGLLLVLLLTEWWVYQRGN